MTLDRPDPPGETTDPLPARFTPGRATWPPPGSGEWFNAGWITEDGLTTAAVEPAVRPVAFDRPPPITVTVPLNVDNIVGNIRATVAAMGDAFREFGAMLGGVVTAAARHLASLQRATRPTALDQPRTARRARRRHIRADVRRMRPAGQVARAVRRLEHRRPR